jgi:hypothetical protein
MSAGHVPREVAVHHMTMGGQPYLAADGVVGFLASAADHWDAAGGDDDPAAPQVARRLRQLSVQLAAEAIQQHDYWMTKGAPEPASSLPGGAKIRTAIRYRDCESRLYFSAVGLSAFLCAAADEHLLGYEPLFDRSSAARMAASYLYDTAEQLTLEAMHLARASGPGPVTEAPGGKGHEHD